MIALDFETDVATGDPVVVSWVDLEHGGPVRAAVGESMREVADLALARGFWAHNAAFDSGCIAKVIGDARPVWDAYERGRIRCTMVGAVLRDIRIDGETHPRGYALDVVCERLGVPVSPDKASPWRRRYGELRHVPIKAWPRDAVRYILDDVRALAGLVAIVRDEVDLERQSCHEWWLSQVGPAGVRTDPDRVRALGARVRAERDEARATCGPLFRPDRIRRDGSRVPGSRNMAAVAAAGLAAGITARTPTGLVQVTEETIQDVDLEAPGAEMLRAYARFLSLDAHASRLLPQLERERVTCRYRLTATGRASASGTRDDTGATVGTNIQNLPRAGGWRECLVPDPGHVWVIIDATGLELATYAECLEVLGCGPSNLARDLRAGIDGHANMASRILGCSLAAVVAALEGRLGPEAQAHAKAARQTAKGPNFGFPGGLGPGGFVAYMRGQGVRLDLARAEELRRTWLDADPANRQWLARASQLSALGDPAVAVRSGRVRGTTRYTEHANTPFQALGADSQKAMGWRLCAEIARGRLPGRYAIFAHDEHVLSVPEADAADVAHYLEQVMSEVGAEWMRHVPLRGEAMLARRWSKQAKAIRDERERLVPWDD